MNISIPDNFDWGDLDDSSISFIKGEILSAQIYHYYNSVKPGDIVVDIGASTGLFSYLSLQKGADKVYCVEPSKSLIKAAANNTFPFVVNKKESPIIFINHAIANETDTEVTIRKYLDIYGSDKNVSTITFKELINHYYINKIDFLKIDCEGGEYDIFTKENLEFLKNNVKFIACEVHGRPTERFLEKFRFFYNKILIEFPYHRFIARVGPTIFDLTTYMHLHEVHPLWIIGSTEVMLYISNSPMDVKIPPDLPMEQVTWVN